MPKGLIRNHSSKILWVVETDTGRAIAHKLLPNHQSPVMVDADGVKSIDGTLISGHNSWWKVTDISTADIVNEGSNLRINCWTCRQVGENEFGPVTYDESEKWGIPMVSIPSSRILIPEWNPQKHVLLNLNKLKDVYKEMTGNDLLGEINTISVREQALLYDSDGILPGCSYSHYYMTAIFSKNTNKEMLSNSIKKISSGSSSSIFWTSASLKLHWVEVSEFTYLFKGFKSFYSINGQIDIMKNTLAEQWRLRHQDELQCRGQLQDLQTRIENLTKEINPIKQAHDEYQICYTQITGTATPHRKQDIEERLSIDYEILNLEPLIQQKQALITKLNESISEKIKKRNDCEKNNITIDYQIENYTRQISDLQSDIQRLGNLYNDIENRRNAAELEKIRLEQQASNTPSRIENPHGPGTILNPDRKVIDFQINQKWREIGDLTTALTNLHNQATAEIYLINQISSNLGSLSRNKDQNNKLIETLNREIPIAEQEKSNTERELEDVKSTQNQKIRHRADLDARLLDIQNEINYLLQRRQNFILYPQYLQKEQELSAAISQQSILNNRLEVLHNESELLLSKIEEDVLWFNKPIPAHDFDYVPIYNPSNPDPLYHGPYTAPGYNPYGIVE